jgi:hypothetical protein
MDVFEVQRQVDPMLLEAQLVKYICMLRTENKRPVMVYMSLPLLQASLPSKSLEL